MVVDSEVSCFGLADGGLSTSVTGGTTPYQFTWNTGHNGATYDSIPAGTYTVTVTDLSTGCSTSETYTIIDDVQNPLELLISTEANTNCVNPNGIAAVSSYLSHSISQIHACKTTIATSWAHFDSGSTEAASISCAAIIVWITIIVEIGVACLCQLSPCTCARKTAITIQLKGILLRHSFTLPSCIIEDFS